MEAEAGTEGSVGSVGSLDVSPGMGYIDASALRTAMRGYGAAPISARRLLAQHVRKQQQQRQQQPQP